MPDPSWPAAPAGWQFFVDADTQPEQAEVPQRPRPSRWRVALLASAAAFVVILVAGTVAAVLWFNGSQSAPPRRPAPATTRPESRTGAPSAAPSMIPAQPVPPPVATAPPRKPSTNARPPGDLGLPTPISFPKCDGQGIVILGSLVEPSRYATGVQQLLDAHPGAAYLRTDLSCHSLRQRTDQGNEIYAVYTLAGHTQAQLCAAVRAAGGNSYGKWLDNTTDPDHIVPC